MDQEDGELDYEAVNPKPEAAKSSNVVLKQAVAPQSNFVSANKSAVPGKNAMPLANHVIGPKGVFLPTEFTKSSRSQVQPKLGPAEKRVEEPTAAGQYEIIAPDKIGPAQPRPQAALKPSSHHLASLIMVLNQHVSVDSLSSCRLLFRPQALPSYLPAVCQCHACGKLRLEVKLPCMHRACANCIQNAADALGTHRALSYFLQIACPACHTNVSLDILRTLVSNELFQRLLQLSRTCFKCTKPRQLLTEFCTELTCMHLCRSCYADELIVGAKNCLVCNTEFIHAGITMQRNAVCGKCKVEGNFVSDCFRSMHDNHLLCYLCLGISGNSRHCEICNLEFDKIENLMLKTFVNKVCSACQQFTDLACLAKNGCCGFTVCENCQSKETKCKSCGKPTLSAIS
jgi:hypothetical protein